MRSRSLLIPVTAALLASASSFLSDALSLDSRQLPCNESDVWSAWGPNCCGEGVCSSIISCTAGEEGCTSTKTTLHITWSQTMTATITPEIAYTQETIYNSMETSGFASTDISQSTIPGTVTSSSNGTQPTTLCSNGICTGTSLQGSFPPSPPEASTTDTSLPITSIEDSTCQESSSTTMTATPLDTSTQANSDAAGSTSVATDTISSPSKAASTMTGPMSSPFSPSTTTTTSLNSSSLPSSAHHTTTAPTTPITGSSGASAERPLVATIAVGIALSLVIVQAILL